MIHKWTLFHIRVRENSESVVRQWRHTKCFVLLSFFHWKLKPVCQKSAHWHISYISAPCSGSNGHKPVFHMPAPTAVHAHIQVAQNTFPQLSKKGISAISIALKIKENCKQLKELVPSGTLSQRATVAGTCGYCVGSVQLPWTVSTWGAPAHKEANGALWDGYLRGPTVLSKQPPTLRKDVHWTIL
jgi:hypothetical protein